MSNRAGIVGAFIFEIVAATVALAAPTERFKADLPAKPLGFEPNQGQTDPVVQFLSRGAGYALFLRPGEVVLNLERQAPASADTVRMSLIGANANANATGLARQPGMVNYFLGNDPKKWRSGIPLYGKVSYERVYPGVDLVFYGNHLHLEYDFVVSPGADAGRIAWRIDGARTSIDAKGNLILNTAQGLAVFNKPVLYQMEDDKRIGVEGSFAVAGDRIGFRLGRYDHSRALVIDPVLSYASYLDGSGNDSIGRGLGPGNLSVGVTQALALDSAGSIYVTGSTLSVDFPTQSPYQGAPPQKIVSPGLWYTAFVSKFSPDGSSLVYSTYLGGEQEDYGYAIAVDSSGSAYVTGLTTSNTFPITKGAYQTVCGPDPTNNLPPYSASCGSQLYSVFVTKLNPAGNGLVYSTYLGGYGWAYATAIAVDAAGNAYIAGNEDIYCSSVYYTFPSCFPTTSGAVIGGGETGGRSPQYAFVAAFDPTGSKLLYSTLFGDLNGLGDPMNGAGDTYGTGVAVDSSGYFYLIGDTSAGVLPTTPGVVQPISAPLGPAGTYVQAWRGFVAKFYPLAYAGLTYATYLGGHTANLNDYTSGITFDVYDNAFITGYTNSKDFPVTPGAYQTVCGPNGQNCAADYVAVLDPWGATILWATYVGGAKPDASDSVFASGPIQLDGNGNVYIVGMTSTGFEMVNSIEPYSPGGYQQLLVTELDPTGSHLLFSTLIGSNALDTGEPAGLAVDATGNIYIAGNTTGPNLITTPGAFQTATNSGVCCWKGFVARIAAQGTAGIVLTSSQSGPTLTMTATISAPQKYASTPTGTVTFQAGSTVLATVNLDSTGTATYSTLSLIAGTYILTATYNGDTTYSAANSITTLTINPTS